MKLLDAIVARLLRVPYTPWWFVLCPVLAGCVRVAEETLLLGQPSLDRLVVNYTVGYLMMQVLLIAVLARVAGRDHRQITAAISAGLIFAGCPPLVDLLLPDQPGRSYRYFTEFQPDLAAPYQLLGETIVAWSAVAVAALFVALLTRSLWRTAVAAAAVYAIGQIYGWGIYAAAAMLYGGSRNMRFSADTVHHADVMVFIMLVVVFAVYALWNLRTLLPSLRRINHALPWGLLAAIGERMAGAPWREAVLSGGIFLLAAFLLVLSNDYFDREQDKGAGGTARPVSHDDLVMVFLLQALLFWWMTTLYTDRSFLLLFFFTLGAAYHLPPIRLKRFLGLPYAMEGLAAATSFLFGAWRAVEPQHGPVVWIAVCALLALGAFAGGSLLKDYKDIDQDRAAGVRTVYTWWLAKGLKLRPLHGGIVAVTSIILLVAPCWFLWSGNTVGAAMLLFVEASLPLVFLLLLSNPTRSIAATIWGVSLYLLTFLAFVPSFA